MSNSRKAVSRKAVILLAARATAAALVIKGEALQPTREFSFVDPSHFFSRRTACRASLGPSLNEQFYTFFETI
jgi:hypothetical protein